MSAIVKAVVGMVAVFLLLVVLVVVILEVIMVVGVVVVDKRIASSPTIHSTITTTPTYIPTKHTNK